MTGNPLNDYYTAVYDIDAAVNQINETVRSAQDRHDATVSYWTEIREYARQWEYDDPDWLNNISGAANSTLTWAGVKDHPPYPPPTAHQPPRSWDELQTMSAQFDQQIEGHANGLRDAASQYQRSRYVSAGTKTSLWAGATVTTLLMLCFGWAVIWMPLTGAFILTRNGTDDNQRRLWTILYPSAVIALWILSIGAAVVTGKVFMITGVLLPAALGVGITVLAFQQTAPQAGTTTDAGLPPPIPTARPQPGPGAATQTTGDGPEVLTARHWGLPGGTVNLIDDGTNSGAVKAGLWGEKQTAALTAQIVNDVRDLWVFHDLTIPNFPGPNVDHAAVRGNMLWLLDSKAWRPGVYVKQHEHMWRDGEQFAAGDTKTMLLAAKKYSEVLPPGTLIYPTIVIHATGGGQISITNHTPNDPVVYITADRLAALLIAAAGQYPPHPPLLEAILVNTMWRQPTPTES